MLDSEIPIDVLEKNPDGIEVENKDFESEE